MKHRKFWKEYYATPAAEQEALMLSYMLGLSGEDLLSFLDKPSGLEGKLGDLKPKEQKYITALIDEQIEILDEHIKKVENRLGQAAA